MLKPYACIACEKVILDNGTIPSLIGLFNRIIAKVSAGAPDIPPNALIPKEWAIFTAWDLEAGDDQRKYIHCMQMT